MTGHLIDVLPLPRTLSGVWSMVPGAVRAAIRARGPLESEQHGSGAKSLMITVGSGAPLRMLEVELTSNGACALRLFEWRKTVQEVATATINPTGIATVLVNWSKEYGLNK